MKKVSIIIPIYNVEKYIERCLLSILEQSFIEDIEIVLVNDGSTDKSIDIAYHYKDSFANLVIIEQPNKGLGYARNVGLENSDGEYIMFLDSDDFLDKDCVEICYNLCKYNNLDRLGFNLKWHYDEDEYEIFSQKFGDITNKVLKGEDLYNYMSKVDHFIESACTCMYKRELLVKNDLFFYADILYEDVLFSINSIIKSNRAMYIKEPFYNYRVRQYSIMTSEPTIKNINSYLFIANELSHMLILHSKDIKLDTIETILNRICKVFEVEIRSIYYKIEMNEEENNIMKLNILDNISNIKREISNNGDLANINIYREYILKLKSISNNLMKI